MKRLSRFIAIIFLFSVWSEQIEAAAVDAEAAAAKASLRASNAEMMRLDVISPQPDPALLVRAFPNVMTDELHALLMGVQEVNLPTFWCAMTTDFVTKVRYSSMWDGIVAHFAPKADGAEIAPYVLKTDQLSDLGSLPTIFLSGWEIEAMEQVNSSMVTVAASAGADKNKDNIFGAGLDLTFMMLSHPKTGISIGCMAEKKTQSLRDRLINYVSVLEGGDFNRTQMEIARRLEVLLEDQKDQAATILPHLGFDADITRCIQDLSHDAPSMARVTGEIVKVVQAWNRFITMHRVDLVTGHGLPGLVVGAQALSRKLLGQEKVLGASEIGVRIFGTPLETGLLPICMNILEEKEPMAEREVISPKEIVAMITAASWQFKAYCNERVLRLTKEFLGGITMIPSWGDITAALASEMVLPSKDAISHVANGGAGKGSGAVPEPRSGMVEIDLTEKRDGVELVGALSPLTPGRGLMAVATEAFGALVGSPVSAAKSVVSKYTPAPVVAVAGALVDAASTYVVSPLSTASGTVVWYAGEGVSMAANTASTYVINPVTAAADAVSSHVFNPLTLAADSIRTTRVGGIVIDQITTSGENICQVTVNGVLLIFRGIRTLPEALPSLGEPVKGERESSEDIKPLLMDPKKILAERIEALADDNLGLDGAINVLTRTFACQNKAKADVEIGKVAKALSGAGIASVHTEGEISSEKVGATKGVDNIVSKAQDHIQALLARLYFFLALKLYNVGPEGSS